MTIRIAVLLLFSLVQAAHTEPADFFERTPFDLWAPTSANFRDLSSTPLMDDLGLRRTLRAQSRAVELLGSEFSRAAAQGLIEAQGNPRQTSGYVASSALGERSNLSVATGIDRDISITSNVPPNASGAVCLSNRDVDLNSWGDTDDPAQLGKLRTNAITEDGEINPTGALKLARFYIALGFGAEAKALLPYIAQASDRDIIHGMADIVDSGESNRPVFQGQIFCDGAVSLWAALASPLADNALPTNTDQILSAFSGLSVHLRSHLGPLLAERLGQAGLKDEARNALNAVTRGGKKTVENVLVEAKLGLSGTQPELARRQLLELSAGTGVTAAKALLELLNDADRRQVPPDISWVEDVPSLVRATEGTPISIELNLAGLNGKIWLKHFDDVRLALGQDGPGLSELTRQHLAVQALAGAAVFASDEEFIRSAIGFEKYFQQEDVPQDDRLAIAERLFTMGLAQRAVSYLPATASTLQERRTASDVLAAIGRTQEAVAILEEKPHELWPRLADLRLTQGDIKGALSSLVQAGRPGSATLLAIRSGNWNWVAESGLESASQAAQSFIGPRDSQETDTPNGSLLEHTQNRRSQAKRLLKILESQELSEAFIN